MTGVQTCALPICRALADELLFGKLASGGKVTIDIGVDDKIKLDIESNEKEVAVQES